MFDCSILVPKGVDKDQLGKAGGVMRYTLPQLVFGI